MLRIIFTVFMAVLFSGCGCKVTYVDEIVNQSYYNAESYIIFGAMDDVSEDEINPIFEYFPQTNTIQFITSLSTYSKYIFGTTSGMRYFLTIKSGNLELMRVNIESGKNYYFTLHEEFGLISNSLKLDFTQSALEIGEFGDLRIIKTNDNSLCEIKKIVDEDDFYDELKETYKKWRLNQMMEVTY